MAATHVIEYERHTHEVFPKIPFVGNTVSQNSIARYSHYHRFYEAKM